MHSRRQTRTVRRHRSVAALGVVVVLVAVLAGYLLSPDTQPAIRPKAAPSPLLRPLPSTLLPGIHVLGRLSPGVAYVLETTDGLALIDAGLASESASLVEQLGELGLHVEDLRAILLTHAHGDHSLGANYLRERSGAKIYAGKDDAPPLRAGAPREAFFANYEMPGVPVHPTPVDVELSGGEVIRLGGTRIQAIATPGHTPGSVCYLTRREGTTALFAGDTIMSVSDLGTASAYLAPRYRGDADGYLRSFRKLLAMPAPDLLLPGHPHAGASPETPPPSARINEQHWRDLLTAGIREMETLTERYQSDGSDFLDQNSKEILPGLHYLGDFSGSAVYCLAAHDELLLFDAPGGPGLAGFLKVKLSDAGLASNRLAVVLLTSSEGEAVSGLPALVEETGCDVVVPEAGADAVRKICPNGVRLRTTESFGSEDRWPVRALPLAGLGRGVAAYQVDWAGKAVLVTGRTLSKMGRGQQRLRQLARRLSQPGVDPDALVRSLDVLAALHVDVWLPAEPVDGQNANLYDNDWTEVVAIYRSIVQQWADALRRSR